MNWIGVLLLIIHVIACTAVILIVLLQAGKGASLGAAFGGGSSQTVFGARSATFIGRMTWVCAGVFMATSLLLTMISPWGETGVEGGSSVLQEEPIAAPPLGEPTATPPPGGQAAPMAPETNPTNPMTGDVPAVLGETEGESLAPAPLPPMESQAMPMAPVEGQPMSGPESDVPTPEMPEQP